jgi:hypothetical protein
MTARFSVKNNHIEDGLILVLKKQTPTVKVITVRIKFYLQGFWRWLVMAERASTTVATRKMRPNENMAEL